MASVTAEEIKYWLGMIVAYGVGVILSCIIAVIHTRNVFMRFSSASSKPETTAALKRSRSLVSCCTLLSIYCYILNLAISLLSIAPFVYQICPFIAINGTWSYLLAKMFMYLVFVWRLHAVYDNSAYRYSKTTLLVMTAIICLSSVILGTLATIRIQPYAGYTERKYLRYCHADIDAYIAGLIALYDFGLSIYSCIAFVLPLRKLVNDTMNASNTSSPKNETYRTRFIALFNVGAKAAILTSTASVTTIIFMIFIGLDIAAGLPPFGFVTNIICMVLMTPYYNKVHYRRLCCLPIRCSKCCMLCCCGFSEDAATAAEIVEVSSKQIQTTASAADGSQSPVSPDSHQEEVSV